METRPVCMYTNVCFVSEEGYWGQQLLEDRPLHPFTKHPHLRFQNQLFHYSPSIVPLQVGGDGCRPSGWPDFLQVVMFSFNAKGTTLTSVSYVAGWLGEGQSVPVIKRERKYERRSGHSCRDAQRKEKGKRILFLQNSNKKEKMLFYSSSENSYPGVCYSVSDM